LVRRGGVGPGGKSGKITITAAREDDAVRIDVSDDGVGMSAQAAHRLTSSISETRSAEDDHFGLYAVQQRLKLEFGKQATLTLAFEEPVGTEVSVRVPSPSKVRE
jgi:two-component system sensor histidine kinase YesM